MRAAIITEAGGPEVLQIREVEDPVAGPDEALVEVHATALNRADLLQRRGRYPGQVGVRDDIPGLEMAGVIRSVGERVMGWKPGDRVMALLAGGGYGGLIAVQERLLMPVPDHLDLQEAAAIPEVFLTAYDALFLQCDLKPGESVLIHAVGSGVGTAATQLARAAGCLSFGTAGSDDKLARSASLGLDTGINYRDADFADVIMERTGGRGVDVVLDVIGAPYWDRNLRSLAMLGRMVVVGTMGGGTVEFDINALLSRRVSVRGTLLRSRPLEQKATLTQAFNQRVLPLFGRGLLRPVIDRVYGLDDVVEAHRYMEANANFGKIVLAHRPAGG